MSKSPKPSKPQKTSYSLRSYLRYLGQYRARVITVFMAFTLADILLAVVPIFIGRLIGSLTGHGVHAHDAWVYVWILAACSAFHDLLWHAGELLYRFLLNRVSYDYETLVFQRIVQKPYPYFVDKFTGKISSYVTSLSQELRDFTEKIFWDYANQAISLVAVIVIMIAVNWQTGLIFASTIAVMFIVGRQTIKNSIRFEKKLADQRSTKNGKIIDAVANFVNIKSFQKEDKEVATIAGEQEKTIDAANSSFVWDVVFWGSMGFFVRDVLWPGTIVLNVYLYIHHVISIADLTTFMSAVLLFSTTVWEMIWHLSQFNLKLARMEEAHSYLFGPVNIVTQPDHIRAANPVHFNERLSLKKLHFAYPDNTAVPVLDNISLELRKGEKVGIVGKSGSGKSTLTKLLLGYYPIGIGQLVLDGELTDSHDLAQLISYVPQDTSLFHRTVADNIAYATDRQVTRDDVIKAAKQAHADEFITQISDGYEALVGERGVKLSAGQRQRIAIARAFLDDKPLLILDEATSALDSESEVLVQEALEALWEHKTVIAIAHRLSTLRHMDRIIVMDRGRIIEQGSHDELLKQKGVYAKLWNHQSGGFLNE